MPVDMEEIKKLPRKDKIKLIGKIWDSIEDTPPNSLSTSQIKQKLTERQEAYKNGTLKTDTWENAKKDFLKKPVKE